MFPSNIIANTFGFQAEPFFQVEAALAQCLGCLHQGGGGALLLVGRTQDHLVEITFTTEPAKYSFINSPIKAQAVVKRIEPRVAGSDNFGEAERPLGGPMAHS